MLNRIVLFLLIWLSSAFSLAGTQNHVEVKGIVFNVCDDYSLVVSIDHRAEIVVLSGIAFAKDDGQDNQGVRNFIRALVLNKAIRIQPLGRDPWGHLLGRIYFDDICLNDALIRAGLAKASLPQDIQKSPDTEMAKH